MQQQAESTGNLKPKKQKKRLETLQKPIMSFVFNRLTLKTTNILWKKQHRLRVVGILLSFQMHSVFRPRQLGVDPLTKCWRKEPTQRLDCRGLGVVIDYRGDSINVSF